MPKQRTRRPWKEGLERRGGRLGLDDRQRDDGAQIREERGDTRIDKLRQTYGDSFAPGIRGDAHLKEDDVMDGSRTGLLCLENYNRRETGRRSVAIGARKTGAPRELEPVR